MFLLIMWARLIVSSLAAPAATLNWEGAGAVPESQPAAVNNTRLLNELLGKLRPGDTLLISNKTFWVAGGVRATDLHSVTLQLDGTLRFLPGRKGWPTQTACGSNPLQPVKSNQTCVQVHICISACWTC